MHTHFLYKKPYLMEYSDTPQFKKILDSLSLKESELLNKAYNFAQKAHEWQKRKSWEDYFIHPLSVGLSLWNRFWNVDLFIAWLLHDTVEDCESLEMSEVYEEFWENIWFIVDSITKTEKSFYREEEIFEDERDKMLSGWAKNIGCILVKLADREHNLATLKHMPAHKQVKKSFESQSLYIPLMHILWFNEEWLSVEKSEILFQNYLTDNKLENHKQIKNELLNICFNDFSEELFDIVYNNSTSVVWELEDREFFDELVEKGWFDNEDVEIHNISGYSNWWFCATFTYKNWVIFDSTLWKLNISKSGFIWI